MTVHLIVTFFAISMFRDNLSVSIYSCAPDDTIIISVPRNEPILVKYSQLWETYYTPVFSGHLDVFEDRLPYFSLHFSPTVYILLTHSVRQSNIDYLPQTLLQWKKLPTFKVIVFSTEHPTHTNNSIQYIHKIKHPTSITAHKKDVDNMIQMLMGMIGDESSLLMFGEDDFPPCDTLSFVLGKICESNEAKSMSGVIFAVGMGGLTFQTRDAHAISRYIQLNMERLKQIDHLLQEWLLKEKNEGRQHLGERRPITSQRMQFNHIGAVSSVGHKHAASSFKCGDSMRNANFPGLNYNESRLPAVFSVSV
jgi:hypothetical protein